MADREKLIELVHDGEQQCSKILCRNCEHFAKLAKCKANMIADHLISHGVTVRERGRWEIYDDGYGCELMYCPICKSEFYDGDNDTIDQLHNFCPNCGADMRPKGEGDEDG